MELRKVVIYKYDKAKNSRHYDKVSDGHGLFHQFGVNYEECGDGVGNFTTAIVELPTGEVVNIPVELIVFNN